MMTSSGRRLGLRLALACLAAFLLAVPFAGLLALVDTEWAPRRDLDEDTTKALNGFVLDHRAPRPPVRREPAPSPVPGRAS